MYIQQQAIVYQCSCIPVAKGQVHHMEEDSDGSHAGEVYGRSGESRAKEGGVSK